MTKGLLWSFVGTLLCGLAGCATSDDTGVLERDGVTLAPAAVRNAWFEELDRVNPALHDALLEALLLSRASGREVFIHKRRLGSDQGPMLYWPSIERGGADNLLSVRFDTREFMFDHFAEEDGPTLEALRDRLYNRERIKRIKRDLDIFGVR